MGSKHGSDAPDSDDDTLPTDDGLHRQLGSAWKTLKAGDVVVRIDKECDEHIAVVRDVRVDLGLVAVQDAYCLNAALGTTTGTRNCFVCALDEKRGARARARRG